MQMQPQVQPQQANPIQATQAMMAQSKAPQPQMPQSGQTPTPPEQGGDQDNFDTTILENLQSHLNTIDDRQKKFLASSLQHYANIVIPVLGIVCGQEVMDYFLNIYKQNFAKGAGQPPQPSQAQPNSAPSPQDQGPNTGTPAMAQQAPAQAPVSQPQ